MKGLPKGQLTQIVETSGANVRIEDPTPFERDDLWFPRHALEKNPLWEAIEAREKREKIQAPARSRFAEARVKVQDYDDDDGDEQGAEDDYMTPYFKKDKNKFTYFDYDNFGTSPAHIDELAMQKAMKSVMKKGAERAIVDVQANAKNLMRQELVDAEDAAERSEELAKIETVTTKKCKFRCQKSKFQTLRTRKPTNYQVCIEKNEHMKWKDLLDISRISPYVMQILNTPIFTSEKTMSDIENTFIPEDVLLQVGMFGWQFEDFKTNNNWRCKV